MQSMPFPVVIFPFRMVLCSQPATRWPAEPPKGRCCIGSIVLASAVGSRSFSSLRSDQPRWIEVPEFIRNLHPTEIQEPAALVKFQFGQ